MIRSMICLGAAIRSLWTTMIRLFHFLEPAHYPDLPPKEAIISATESPITITVVAHATALNNRVLVYSPINSFLLINISMKIRTNGSTMPLMTCDHTTISINRGAGMTNTSAPPAIISSV